MSFSLKKFITNRFKIKLNNNSIIIQRFIQDTCNSIISKNKRIDSVNSLIHLRNKITCFIKRKIINSITSISSSYNIRNKINTKLSNIYTAFQNHNKNNLNKKLSKYFSRLVLRTNLLKIYSIELEKTTDIMYKVVVFKMLSKMSSSVNRIIGIDSKEYWFGLLVNKIGRYEYNEKICSSNSNNNINTSSSYISNRQLGIHKFCFSDKEHSQNTMNVTRSHHSMVNSNAENLINNSLVRIFNKQRSNILKRVFSGIEKYDTIKNKILKPYILKRIVKSYNIKVSKSQKMENLEPLYLLIIQVLQ